MCCKEDDEMKKKLFSLLFAFVLVIVLTTSAFAAPVRLVDDAGLLSAGDSAELLSALDAASEKTGMDIVVVTVKDLGGKSAEAFADDYFDYNGYGMGTERSGILLLVSIGTGDVWISTRGHAIDVFTDSTIDYILDSIFDDLVDGNYYSAFSHYAELCVSSTVKAPFKVGSRILSSLVIGFVIALISTSVMKGKLKTVKNQVNASQYTVPGSLYLTDSRDIFLYHTVNRVRKAEQQSSSGSTTHISSSGARHGGGGRKF